MGIALYLIWSKGTANKEVKAAIKIFSIQLFLNVFWSFAFFWKQITFVRSGSYNSIVGGYFTNNQKI